MKAYPKRDATVPGAPEEMYAQETPWAYASPRGPAPAGALQRHYEQDEAPSVEEAAEEPEYVPVRGRFRLRGALRSTTGRIVLAVGAFAFFVIFGGSALVARMYLLHDQRFVVPTSEHIEIVGNTHMTRAELLSVFGEDVERNIFKVPLAQRRADLERLPWIEHATVMRLLPNTLRIAVVERTPVAFVRQGSQIGLVDANGVLLDMPSDAGDPHYSFPVLTGLSADDPLSTRAARMEIYHHFMQDLDSSGEKVTENLSEVDVSSPEDVKAVISSGGSDILVHFGDQQFLERYRHFQQHLAEWKQQYPNLDSADMRYDRQVVLEMKPGTTVPPPADAVASNNGDLAAAAVKAAGHADVPAADSEAPPAIAPPAVKPIVPAHHAAVKPVNAGGSSANARMFAALAAARRQQEDSGQGPQ